MASEFNPIAYSSELESAGVPKEQAAAHAKALISVLADVAFTVGTLLDMMELRAEIGLVRAELVLHRWILCMILVLSTANLALTIRLTLQ